MYKVIVVFILFVICAELSSQSQNLSSYRFETIDNTSGLPNNSVWDMESDVLGFLWAATSDGLCRIETNNRIKVFRSEEYPELISDNIRALKSDSKGNMWIGKRHSGLTRYDLKTGKWRSYNHDDSDPNSLVDDEVLTITEDDHNNIWIGTENGFSIYNYESDNFINYKQDKSDPHALQSKAVLSIYNDNVGRIWIGTWGSGMYLALYNKERDLSKLKFRHFAPIEGKDETYNVWCINQDNQGRYWIGTFGGGLFNMTLSDGASDEFGDQDWETNFHSIKYNIGEDVLTDDNISDIQVDNNGSLWIGTTNGINVVASEDIADILSIKSYDSSKSPVKKILHMPDEPFSIPYSTIYSVHPDKQGLVWISTIGGIGVCNPNQTQFYNYDIGSTFSNSIYSQNIYVNDDRLSWITGYGNGLEIYDFNNRSLINFEEHMGRKFDHGTVLSMLSDENFLYVTTNEKLVIYDLTNDQENVHFLNEEIKEYIRKYNLVSSYKDSKGHFYFSTDLGLIVYDLDSQTHRILVNDQLDKNSLVDNSVTSVLEDSEGTIWVSTYNGLSQIEDVGDLQYTITNIKHSSEDTISSIYSNQVICMSQIGNKIYFGLNSGICSYDLTTDTFDEVTEQGENYYVQSMVSLEDHTLWMGTLDGILSIDIPTNRVKLYNKKDGITKDKLVPFGAYADNNNHIFFTTNRGVIEIDPEQILKNEVEPEVYVTDIKVLSSDGERSYNGYELEKLELSKNDYYVSFNFAAINYIRSEKNKYAYRLEGFEENWNYPDNNVTNAIYTNLDAGLYNFQVKACNNDGIWNEKAFDLTIDRKPGLTETLSFKLLSILLSLLFIFFCFKLYTNNVRRRNVEMENIVAERTEELELKKKEVEELLSKIQNRNSELEEIVALRTQNLLEANNDLTRSNSDLEQFAYIASHDLQEPLRTIGTFTSLLGRKLKGNLDESSQEYIDFIVDGVHRMSELIKSILTYSQVGKEICIDKIDLNKILSSKIKDLSKRIHEKNAQVTIGELPNVNCDGGQIGMVFYNLINNGIKFNKKDIPSIDVKHIDDDNDYFKFSVRDNGIGIQKEYQGKIFELFNRLNLKSEYEGTGIGLTLCERIITKHEGKIWLESVEGEGTTFYFTISKHLVTDN